MWWSYGRSETRTCPAPGRGRRTAEDATKLEEKLPEFVKNSAIESVQTKDGSKITVNFAHVVVAYIDDLQRKGRVFGLH
jgi:hypothetical protein